MPNLNLLSEIVETAERVRQYGADAFGPWAPVLTTCGQAVAFGIAILALVAGRSF
jgi:hypothetical protein